MIYALDTNIISYIMNGNNELAEKLREITVKGNNVVIPLMVYYEIRRGLISNKATVKMKLFDELCARLPIPDLTKEDMNSAANIYAKHKRSGKPIDDGDLLIAAQCITNGHTLVTNNTKHFDGIDGLNFTNWCEEGSHA